MIGHPYVLFSALHLTAGSDYTSSPYTVSFSAGQASAMLMVSTNDDDEVELSEYFKVMISSVDTPEVVEIGSPSTTVVTIEDNNPGNVQLINPCEIVHVFNYFLSIVFRCIW